MSTKAELEHQVLMAARDTVLASVFFRNAMGHRAGLSITDYECVSYLGIKGTASPSELARYTGLTPGSTTAMIDRLEKAGYVRRTPNPNDRRGTLVEISQHNQAASKELVVGIQKAHKELLASCSQSDLETVLKFLTGFARNTVEATEEIEKEGKLVPATHA
jgi:DNA-binding MarR family transcriptional regulator